MNNSGYDKNTYNPWLDKLNQLKPVAKNVGISVGLAFTLASTVRGGIASMIQE